MHSEKRTALERRRLVDLYESRGTGVTREQFCRTHSIATSTLDYWRSVERRGQSEKLIAVEVEPANNRSSAGATGFALSLPNGRRIETNWRFADADLARLIRIAESV